MRRTKTMLMGDLLDEFFSRPYIAAKVAEGRLPDTWRAIVGDRVADLTVSLRLENHVLYAHISSSVRARSSSSGANLWLPRSTACRE